MTDRPNILLIIADHQAFYGHHRPGEFEYLWPRYEAFCAEGVRFPRAYSGSPICTPVRTSMMTGVMPSHHGLVKNTENPFGPHDLPADARLYSHHLADHGYRTTYFGKWHCGHERLPEDYGMEGWSLPDYGTVYMSDAYRTYAEERGFGPARALVEHESRHPEREGEIVVLHDESPWAFMNASGVLQGPPEAHEEQFVAHLAGEKIRELAAGDAPWSMVASFWGPHQAFYPSEPFASLIEPTSIPEYPTFRDDLAGRPVRHHLARDTNHPGARRWADDWATWQEILCRAYGQGLQTDAAIGQILDVLEEVGATDNTIVLWTTDHGDAAASHGGCWDKASVMTEEVMRVPMAIRWPQRVSGGGVFERPVRNTDVTATMLDAAGVPIPDSYSSASLLPLCEDPDAPWTDGVVCEHHGHIENILQRMLVTERFKYVAALFDGDELYDLETDPFEVNNLVQDPDFDDVARDMKQRLIDHITANRDFRAFQLRYVLQAELDGTIT